MGTAVRYESPSGETTSPFSLEGAWPAEDRHQPRSIALPVDGETGPRWSNYSGRVAPFLLGIYARLLSLIEMVFVTRPPSLIIFTSVGVTATLFMALVTGITSAQISGDLSGALGAVLLVVVSLPIVLLSAIFLAVAVPYRVFASSSKLVAMTSSYLPYVLGALTGIWATTWLSGFLPFEYQALTGPWKWTIAVAGPGLWLVVGLVSNHLASMAEHQRGYEKGMDELRESRHRIMLVHEQTRKEVAGLLHGRVQGRMVVLGHWLKDCQERFKDDSFVERPVRDRPWSARVSGREAPRAVGC